MASLRQQRRYGLSCGKNHGGPGNRTLFHVKLTDTALRALEAHRNLKESLPGKPSICFQGNQGYIKIPASAPQSPAALRVFTFYLSRDAKDQPQASFDCIHQFVSSDGREQLEGQGVIQDKITVCATDDSYKMTRERMSRVKKDNWSRSVIEIKPGATHQIKGVKFHKRLAPLCASENSFQRQSANNRRNSCIATATHKPFRERIIHLLALKAYRKPELLLWMEQEKASPRDKAELGGILEEVAKVNPKDGSYVLQDRFYRLVQKDWPNYSEEERRLIGRLLARKLLPNSSCQPKNLTADLLVLKSSGDEYHSSINTPPGKHLLAFESLERFAVKRQRLAVQRPQQHLAENRLLSHNSHNATSPAFNPSSPSETEIPQAAALTDIHNAQNVFLCNTQTVSKGRMQETNVEPQSDQTCPHEPLIAILHRKKSKKHKDEERDWSSDDQSNRWLETSKLKQKPSKTDNSEISSTAAMKPDYVLMYGPIVNLEQRHSYQEDFCSEYNEYKELHSRIATITHMFVQLGSKIKSLSPGTAEYKIMEDRILEKYSKYQRKFPGYREEKKRCKYLHEKLSYIKQLIINYDVSQAGESIHCG